MSVDYQWIPWCYIPEDRNLQGEEILAGSVESDKFLNQLTDCKFLQDTARVESTVVLF